MRLQGNSVSVVCDNHFIPNLNPVIDISLVQVHLSKSACNVLPLVWLGWTHMFPAENVFINVFASFVILPGNSFVTDLECWEKQLKKRRFDRGERQWK
ncbi:hypothetical protein JTB14_016068 [Gonioctena quinquepunctata]|nr:hypothetical protein JTB14_016068 [Gonioctena quinquepunctata]